MEYSVPVKIDALGDPIIVTVKITASPKVLNIQLTDNKNPYFLYALHLKDTDYISLKQQQNLLIEFTHFPQKFTELLQLALNSPNYYACHLITVDNTTTFSVVETNSFKHITHVALTFVKGNDTDVKIYLASVVNTLKGELSSLQSTLKNTSTTLDTVSTQSLDKIKSLELELSQLKASSTDKFNELQLAKATQTAEQNEIHLKALDEIRRTGEKAYRDLEIKNEEEIRSLTQKTVEQTITNKHITQHAEQLEKSLSTTILNLENIQRDTERLRLELDRKEQEVRVVDKRNNELEREVSLKSDAIKRLERGGSEVDQTLRGVRGDLEVVLVEKEKINYEFQMLKQKATSINQELEKSILEIHKANEIIKKLQQERLNFKKQLKLKNEVTIQQEKLIEERLHNQNTLYNEVNEVKDKMLKKQDELTNALTLVGELEKKAEESRKIIDDNNHVIEWLHKQLNEEAITRPVLSTTAASNYQKIDFEKYSVPKASILEPVTSSNKSPVYRNRFTPQPSTSPTHPTSVRGYTRPTTAPVAKSTSPTRFMRQSLNNNNNIINSSSQRNTIGKISNVATGTSFSATGGQTGVRVGKADEVGRSNYF